jgi:type I restriction enzyme S subunit
VKWAQVQLGEISSVDYGHTASATPEQVGPKFLRITDIQNGTVIWDSVPYCKCKQEEERASQLAQGDIVFARTGATTGKSFLIRSCPVRAVFASYLIRLRPKPEVSPEYLAHFFNTPEYWAQVSLKARGAAQAGVNASVLKTLRVPLPPLPEQRRIAAILDKAEVPRAKRREALTKLDSQLAAAFVALFGASDQQRWPVSRLVDVISMPLRNGLSPSSEGTHPGRVLTLSAITGAMFYPSAVKDGWFQSLPPADQTVNEADLLICRGNGNPQLVGKGYFPSCTMPDVLFPDTMIAARIDTAKINRAFIQQLWNSPSVRRQIQKLARTTNGTYKVNQQMLEGISFISPPLDLQHAFAERASAVAKLKELGSESQRNLDALFASLQHRAFRGEL